MTFLQRIEILEFLTFLFCATSCYHNITNFPESSKDSKSNIKDYRCRFFKALFVASLSIKINDLIIDLIIKISEINNSVCYFDNWTGQPTL